MISVDIIDFDPANLKHSAGFYGFDSFLQLGKDVSLHSAGAISSQRPAPISIISSNDTEQLIRLVKKFDIVYSTIYDASPALLTRMAVAKRKALVNISDILGKEGAEGASTLHRISRFLQFCRSYRVETIIASMAKDEFGIRSPREAADVLAALGATAEQVRYSFSSIHDIMK